MESESKVDNVDSIILEEEIDPNYVPSEAEVIEYAKWLGMDLQKDQDLFWIAREGLKAPLPENWKPCKTKDTDDIYYFNFTTGDSTWDHPCDGFYKRLYEEEKKKKETTLKENNDTKRNQAKQDAQQLLGKSDKKAKKKPKPDALEPPGAKSETTLAPVLDRKPLPGIKPPLGALSSSLGKMEAKPVDDLSPRLSTTAAPAPLESPSAFPTMKSSSKLGLIGSLRVPSNNDANNNNNQSMSSSSLGPSNSLDSKPLDRPKYRDDQKPSPVEERSNNAPGKEPLAPLYSSHPDYNTADAKEYSTPRQSERNEPPLDKPVPVEQPYQSTYQPAYQPPQNNNFEQQERQMKAEIERLMADNTRLAKKAEYWEHELQNSNRKNDQNAVYYNDRINTLDSELLDAKRQVVAKDEELFSAKSAARNLENELSRTKDMLATTQSDANRRQQLQADQLAVEQRKLATLEMQMKDLQMSVYGKDDEIRKLKYSLDNLPATSSNNSTSADPSSSILQAKIDSLQQTIQSLESKNNNLDNELRDALRRANNSSQEVDQMGQEIATLRQQVSSSSASTNNNNAEVNRQVEYLQRELNQLRENNSTLNNTLRQKDLDMEKTQLQHQSMVNEMKNKLEDAEKSKLFLTHSITEKDQDLAVLRRKTELLEQTQAMIHNNNTNNHNNNNQEALRNSQEREMRLISQHEQEIANMRGKIEDLKHELSLLQINLSAANSTLHVKIEDNEHLRLTIAKLQESIALLEREKRERDVTNMQLNTQLDAKNLDIARLQSAANQLEYFQEVARVREEEIAKLKMQLMNSVQQQQQQQQQPSVVPKDTSVSAAVLSDLQMDNNLLKTKLETKQAEMRSKMEEVQFLQDKLDEAYKEVSAAQNQARGAQTELKALKVENETLHHQWQSETDASNAKDKKIRGFREELLHLQKLLSDAEASKRKEKDTSDAHTQTKPDPVKEVAHQGVQKSVLTYEIGVSAYTVTREVGSQASSQPPPSSTANATQQKKVSCSMQTDPYKPEVEIREIIRLVPDPTINNNASNNNNSNSNHHNYPQLDAVSSEMKLQMQYMREVKEELGEKMQQCNQLLSAIAAKTAAAVAAVAADTKPSSTNTATATNNNSGGRRNTQFNNFLRDSSGSNSPDSPRDESKSRKQQQQQQQQQSSNRVQIVHDENFTPNHNNNNNKDKDRSNSIKPSSSSSSSYYHNPNNTAADEMDSVSEVMSPFNANTNHDANNNINNNAAFNLVDQLSALFAQLLQTSVGYKASTSGDSRLLHNTVSSLTSSHGNHTNSNSNSNSSSVSQLKNVLTRIAENKHRAIAGLLKDYAANLLLCKDVIRQGRQTVLDMKSNYHHRNNQHGGHAKDSAKQEINELTYDLNLAIRLARKLQETMDDIRAMDKDISSDLSLCKTKSRTSDIASAASSIATQVVQMDRSVDVFAALATELVNDMSRNHTHNNSIANHPYPHPHPRTKGYPTTATATSNTMGYEFANVDETQSSDFDSDALFVSSSRDNYRNYNHNHRDHRDHQHSYPTRSASPPSSRGRGSSARMTSSRAHHQHQHQHHIGNSHNQYSSRATSLSPTRTPTMYNNHHHQHQQHHLDPAAPPRSSSSSYRDKLDIIQRQLSSAQQHHVDSLREYDRHYNWLGSLVKEIGHQATAPVVYRSMDSGLYNNHNNSNSLKMTKKPLSASSSSSATTTKTTAAALGMKNLSEKIQQRMRSSSSSSALHGGANNNENVLLETAVAAVSKDHFYL